MSFEDIIYQVSEYAAYITINRPKKRNALRGQTFQELTQACELASRDDTVRAVVLTGAGDKAFCSGGDIAMAKDFHNNDSAARHHAFNRMLALSTAITQLGKPVLAAVNGVAVGGGVELLCFCDFVIAADSAYFWLNGSELGGCSWWGAPQLLPLMVGLRRAEEILYFSRKFSAREAADWGFVNSTVPDTDLMSEIDRYREQLADISYDGLRQTKAAIRATRDLILAPQQTLAEVNATAMAGGEIFASFELFGRERSR